MPDSGAVCIFEDEVLNASELEEGRAGGMRQGTTDPFAAPGGRNLALVLAVYVVVWTILGWTVAGVIHHDMAEAWAWGKEFQLGYWKHPPLFAWVAGLWFEVLPRQNWSFYLLSAVNAAVGLAGVWAIAGRTLDRAGQLLSVLMVMVTPFYTILALKFNANAILLSLWPWTAYAFLRMLDRRTIASAIAFGALAALAMLGKYYSALLLASFFVATLVTPETRRLYLTPVPYVAALSFAVVIAPHVVWAIGTGLQTVAYAISKTEAERGGVLIRGLSATAQAIAFQSLAIGLLVYAVRGQFAGFAAGLRAGWWRPEVRPLVVLAVLPFLLTVLACLVANVRISAQFLMPAFFLLPVALLTAAKASPPTARVDSIGKGLGILSLVMIVAAPAVAHAARHMEVEYWRPATPRLAEDVGRLWHRRTARPLRIVAAPAAVANLVAFYSPDRPSALADVDRRLAPWISEDRLKREGAVMICPRLFACPIDALPGRKVLHIWSPRETVSGRRLRMLVLMVLPEALAAQ